MRPHQLLHRLLRRLHVLCEGACVVLLDKHHETVIALAEPRCQAHLLQRHGRDTLLSLRKRIGHGNATSNVKHSASGPREVPERAVKPATPPNGRPSLILLPKGPFHYINRHFKCGPGGSGARNRHQQRQDLPDAERRGALAIEPMGAVR